jgi:hypothetical protein
LTDGGKLEIQNSQGAPGTLQVTDASGSGTGAVNIGEPVSEAAAAPGVIAVARIQGGGARTHATMNLNHTATVAVPYVVGAVIGGLIDVNAFAGATELTGANQYTGRTTVGGGSAAAFLIAGNAAALGDSSLAVTRNGTLKLADTVETLSLAEATFAGGGTLDISLPMNATAPPLLEVGGMLSVTGSEEEPFHLAVAVPEGFVFPADYSWSFATATGGIAGDLAAFDLGVDGLYLKQEGNDLVLSTMAAPEPSTLLLLGCGVAVSFRRRRAVA